MLNCAESLVTAVMAMLDAYEHRDDGGDRGSRYYWWSGCRAYL